MPVVDSNISSLPAATSIDDNSLLVVEQQGEALKSSGQLWKNYAVQAISPYVTQVQGYATQAANSAQIASNAIQDIEGVTEAAEAAQEAASAALAAAEAAQESAETALGQIESSIQSVINNANAAANSASAASTSETNAASSASDASDAAETAVAAAGQASTSAENAAGSAEDAADSATAAAESASSIVGSVQQAAQSAAGAVESASEAEQYASDAQAAQQAIENLTVQAETLPVGESATVEKSTVQGVVNLLFGLPTGATGAKGDTGNSVQRIERTSGTGAAGTTDTYTVYLTDGSVGGTFQVYNGINGTGSGDFLANGSIAMTGNLQMGGNKITNVGAPTSNLDAVRKQDLDAVATEVDNILDGSAPIYIPAATATTIGGVIIGDGLSIEVDGTISADDQLPTGGTQGQVLAKGTAGPEWIDAPNPLPTGGETGQVLTKTTNGASWQDAPSYSKPLIRTATILASGWSNKSQNVSVSGVVANSDAQVIFVSPANKDDATEWANAGVFCSSQGANRLTFVCDTVPTNNIVINISIHEAQT